MMKVLISLLVILCVSRVSAQITVGGFPAECTPNLTSSSNSNFTDILKAPYLWVNQSSVVPSAAGGLLTVVIHSHAYYKNITIEFDAEINQSGNHSTACDYFLGQSGNLNWTEAIEGSDNCGINFTGKFDIRTALRKCFHFYERNADYEVYETNIRLTTVFARNGSRNETNVDRVYVTANKMRIRFPININVTLSPNTEGKNVTAYGYNVIFGDVILQRFEQESYATRVWFYTTVNPPYMLNTSAQSVSTNYSISQTVLLHNDVKFSCLNDNSSICTELWEVLITPTAGQCKIEADVTLNFTVGCRPTFGGLCNASLLTPPTYAVTFRLLSNDFCPQLINDGVITGFINSYSDSSLQSPQASFLYNQRLHFRIHINKDFGPNIINTNINYVTVESAGVVTFTPGTSTIASFQYQNTWPTSDEAYFSFIAGRESISFVNTDRSQKVNVSAYVTVFYEQLTANGMQIQQLSRPVHFTTQATAGDGAFTTTADIAPATADNSASSGVSGALIIPVAAAVGGFVAITALVLFLRKRRLSRESGAQQDEPKMLFV